MLYRFRLVEILVASFMLLLFQGCGGNEDAEFLEDYGALLNSKEKERLVAYNTVLLQDLDIHFKLITLAEQPADLDLLAVELFGRLGEKTHASKGLLFLVDSKGKQVRIEVGYDLETVFPDVFIGFLERAQMVPFFRANRIGAGIEAMTELLVARVQREISGNSFNPKMEIPDMDYFSGGGGAKITVTSTVETSGHEVNVKQGDYSAQGSPAKTLEKYMLVLQHHVKKPDLPLYTQESQEFFSNWVVTDAQQENELRTLTSSAVRRILVVGDYAVMRFPQKQRTLPPYFFQKSADGWRLDFATMSQVIRMNHRNMWHFATMKHSYMFGFSDWVFDHNGFPVGINGM